MFIFAVDETYMLSLAFCRDQCSLFVIKGFGFDNFGCINATVYMRINISVAAFCLSTHVFINLLAVWPSCQLSL